VSDGLSFTGRLWVLSRDGDLIDDIDTDMIYHNSYLAVTDRSEMARYALGNLEGYEDFAERAQEGDMILAGENFGSGSSRQHAVDCFLALGVRAIVARSFGAIYRRNAINSALPVVEAPEVTADRFEHLEEVEIDLQSGLIRAGETEHRARPMSGVALDIYRAGGLFQYASTL
jgi:3-isopropylmalate/(R)-2-methylmalate dehydratase small subunit